MISSLNFCYKGERNYVHGTDIVNALYSHFIDDIITDIDLKFNGISLTNLDLFDGYNHENVKVNVRLTLNGEKKNMQLIENGESINCRKNYNEDKIINLCNINLARQEVSLNETTGYTLCENFVAMNKFLLQSIYPDVKGKWYFTQLVQKHIVENNVPITIKLIKNFNFRLTKSDILVGNENIGSVYFSMVKD